MAQKIEGTISSVGLQNGLLGIVTAAGPSVQVKVSEIQRQKMLPSLHIGDKVQVWMNEDSTIKGGINVVEKAEQKQVSNFPTKKEETILKEGYIDSQKQNSIMWQSCMKIAVEIEKFYATGGAEDRVETCKNVIVSTNNLYESSLRKMRGLPPIPETAPQ